MIAPWGEETRRAQPTALARRLRRCDKGARRWILGPIALRMQCNVAHIDSCIEKALGATLAQRVARVVGGVGADSYDCGTQTLDEVGAQDGAVAGVGEQRVAHEREHAVRGWFQEELDERPVRRGVPGVVRDADRDALVQRVRLAAMQKDAGQRDAVLLHDGVVGATRIKLLLVRTGRVLRGGRGRGLLQR